MKKIVLIASAIIALVACSKNEVSYVAPVPDSGEDVISFGNYNGRAITKAGKVGDITTDILKADDAGFGVFAYYTAAKDYVKTSGSSNQNDPIVPNFLFNEKVYWDGTSSLWKYDNIKYWPNDNNDADNGNSTGSVAASKVSFFAYAPYVVETTTFSTETNGIVGISSNQTAGNPVITYQVSSNGNGVDLLWGTAGDNGEDINGNAQPGNFVQYNNGTADVNALYKTNVNLVKMKTDGKVKFLFKHALAQVGGSGTKTATISVPTRDSDGAPDGNSENVTVQQGGLQVKLNVDDINGGALDPRTIVTVKSIKITNDINGNGTVDTPETVEVKDIDGNTISTTNYNAAFVSRGDFDLATGVWNNDQYKNDSKYNKGKVEISLDNSNVAVPAIDPNATTPIVNDALSSYIAEPTSVSAFNQLPIGVQVKAQSVYADKANPLVLLPGTVPVLKFTISYVVRSYDKKLQKNYTEVEQTISKIVSFNSAIEVNKIYNIIIGLGLTSVKFEATVSPWSCVDYDYTTDPPTPIYGYDNSTTPPTPITDPTDPRLGNDMAVDLPINVQ